MSPSIRFVSVLSPSQMLNLIKCPGPRGRNNKGFSDVVHCFSGGGRGGEGRDLTGIFLIASVDCYLMVSFYGRLREESKVDLLRGFSHCMYNITQNELGVLAGQVPVI